MGERKKKSLYERGKENHKSPKDSRKEIQPPPPWLPQRRHTSLTLSLSASDLATETGLDSGDGTTGSAGVAGNEVQTVLTLVEFGVGTAASLASNVFDWLYVRMDVR